MFDKKIPICFLLLSLLAIGCGVNDSNSDDTTDKPPDESPLFDEYSTVEDNRATLVASMPLVEESETDKVYIRDLWGFRKGNEKYIAIGTALEGDSGLGDFVLHIVNVTDPENPVLASTLDGINAQDIKYRDHYLYTVTGGHEEEGGHIIDVSDPSNPVVAGGFHSAHNIFIDQNGLLYLTGSSTSIYDLNGDPENPERVTTLDGIGSHDITVEDGRLYIFSGKDEPHVSIHEVNPQGSTSPIQEFSSEHIFFSHSGWPVSEGKYLVVNDEYAINDEADFTIWDLSQDEPALVYGLYDPNATVHNVMIEGNYAYMSYYTAGFRIFDISDPENPELVGEVDTSPFEGELVTSRSENSISIHVRGAWGVFSQFNDGYAYISDVNTGLHIIKIDV